MSINEDTVKQWKNQPTPIFKWDRYIQNINFKKLIDLYGNRHNL